MIATPLRAFLAVPLLVLAAHGDVRVVPHAYTTIQAAVDAAGDGDVVLVWPGNYAFFSIFDKSVTVVARSPGVYISGMVRVQDLQPHRRVALIGLAVTANGKQALRLADCAGSVRVYGGTYRGTDLDPAFFNGDHAVYASDCDDVAFTAATLIGGRGVSGSFDSHANPGGRGGSGLIATRCRVALHDCILIGGHGGSASFQSGRDGGDGGSGAEVRFPVSSLFSSKSTFTGGNGGAGGGEDLWCASGSAGSGGAGGHGVLLSTDLGSGGPHADLIAFSAAPGSGGQAGQGSTWCPSGSNGPPGQPVAAQGSATFTQHPWSPRSLEAPGPWRGGQQATLTFRGEPGDAVFLLRSVRTSFVTDLSMKGVRLLGGIPQIQEIGTIGASGVLTRTLTVPAVPVGFEGVTVQLQALMVSATQGLHLTGAAPVASLHPSF